MECCHVGFGAPRLSLGQDGGPARPSSSPSPSAYCSAVLPACWGQQGRPTTQQPTPPWMLQLLQTVLWASPLLVLDGVPGQVRLACVTFDCGFLFWFSVHSFALSIDSNRCIGALVIACKCGQLLSPNEGCRALMDSCLTGHALVLTCRCWHGFQ